MCTAMSGFLFLFDNFFSLKIMNEFGVLSNAIFVSIRVLFLWNIIISI